MDRRRRTRWCRAAAADGRVGGGDWRERAGDREAVSGSELVTLTAQILLAAILVPVLLRAVRERTRSAVDVALFFGLLDLLLLRSALGLANVPLLGPVSGALSYALPYLMLRLLADFTAVRKVVVRGSEAALVLLAVSAFVYQGLAGTVPGAIVAVRTLYFVVLFAYAGAGFLRLARTSTGVTRRRMQAISIGNALFALVIAGAGAIAVLPALALTGAVVVGPGILATSVAWLLGFAPPGPLRRFWQEPELRAFFARTAAVPRLIEPDAAAREIVD